MKTKLTRLCALAFAALSMVSTCEAIELRLRAGIFGWYDAEVSKCACWTTCTVRPNYYDAVYQVTVVHVYQDKGDDESEMIGQGTHTVGTSGKVNLRWRSTCVGDWTSYGTASCSCDCRKDAAGNVIHAGCADVTKTTLKLTVKGNG